MRSILILGLGLFSLAGKAGAVTFGAPRAVKVGWEAQALYLGDVDGDGLQDFAYLDNGKARIVVRYGLPKGQEIPRVEELIQRDKWDPVLENAPYLKTWVTTGVTGYDLLCEDLDGDGRKDLVYTNDRDRLVILPQLAGRKWGEAREFKLKGLKNNWLSLAAADCDLDGDLDLAVIGGNKLFVVTMEQGQFGEVETYEVGEEVFGLQWADFDRDGALDILYQDSEDGRVLIRRQVDGSYPVEQVLAMDGARASVKVVESEDQVDVLSISRETGALEKLRVKKGENRLTDEKATVFSYRVRGGKEGDLSCVQADLDGDGVKDLVLSSRQESVMTVLKGKPGGGFGKPVESAMVAGVESLAVGNYLPEDGLEVVVLSPKEKMFGICSVGGDGALSFPKQIQNTEVPLVITGDGASILALEKNGVKRLQFNEGKWESAFSEIKGIGDQDPVGLRLFDLNQDGREDLLVMNERKSLGILLRTEDGYRAAEEQREFAEKLTAKISPTRYGSRDVDGDGQEELLVVSKTFVRAIRLGEGEQLEVVRQVNVPGTLLNLKAVVCMGDEGLGVYDEKSGELMLLSERGKLRTEFAVPLEAIGALEKTQTGIILLGKNEAVELPFDREVLQTERLASYQSSLKDFHLVDFRGEDLNRDGQIDVVGCDSTNSHVIELLIGTEEGWLSQQHFQIYEVDRHFRGKRGGDYQPEDIHLKDMDGDGKPDLVLHVHDRVLIYGSEGEESGMESP